MCPAGVYWINVGNNITGRGGPIMIRFSYTVMALLIAIAVAGCKADRDLQIGKNAGLFKRNPVA